MSDEEKQKLKRGLAWNIARFLADEGDEELDVARQLLAAHYGVDADDAAQRAEFGLPRGAALIDLYAAAARAKNPPAPAPAAAAAAASDGGQFEAFVELLRGRNFFAGLTPGSAEYAARMEMARKRFASRSSSQSSSESEDEKRARAEEHKGRGNAALQAGRYEEAVREYTRAIELWPGSAIYLANRAAALSYLRQHERAAADCERAIAIDPRYAKAHSRLGLALFELGRFRDAVARYDRALELEPANAVVRKNRAEAQAALDAVSPAHQQPQQPQQQPQTQQTQGLAQMAEQMMQQNPGLRAAAESFGAAPGGLEGLLGGGGGGLGALLNNPQVMSMAQQVMSNPELMSSLFGAFGGAAAQPQQGVQQEQDQQPPGN